MIRAVARCPFCGCLSAGVDDDGPDLVMAPDGAGGRPCGHLAFLSVGVHVVGPRGRSAPARSRAWLWARGDGRAAPAAAADPLVEYVGLVACGLLPADDRPSPGFRVAGGTAGEREAAEPGTGEFPVGPPGHRRRVGVLDGHGLYSRDPDALAAEVRRMARCG